jgi:signal transduction histidine kinase
VIDPHSFRLVYHKARRVVLAGLGALLALLLGFGLYAARSLDKLSASEIADVREYLSRVEYLGDVERHFTSASNSVRDYFLDPHESALPGYREQARRSLSQAMAAAREYREIATDRREPTDAIETQLSRYRAAADAAFQLDGSRRLAGATSVFYYKLLPMRDEFLATIKNLDSRDQTRILSAAGNTKKVVRSEKDWLLIAIGTAAVLALLITLMTFKHLAKLAEVAADYYLHAAEVATELRQLSERLLNSQEEERRRIARELHDDYGQRMASLIFELSSTAERSDVSPELRLAMQAMGERLGNLAKDLQQVSHGLHSAVLEKIGLEAAVRSDCDTLSKRSVLSVNFRATGVPRRLPDSIALAMYRVSQEAVQNALKHSRTGRLDVSIAVTEGELVLRVQDFGRGFETKSYDWGGSLGLLSMRERLRIVGGSFAIHSEIGSGTEVEARVPLP